MALTISQPMLALHGLARVQYDERLAEQSGLPFLETLAIVEACEASGKDHILVLQEHAIALYLTALAKKRGFEA